MQKIAILFNPSSRKGRSGKSQDKIERVLNDNNINYDLFVSDSKEHLKQLTVETARKYPTIVGVGGDTTLNIMVRRLLRSDCPFPVVGMIGTGSANDIVRSLGIYNIEDACTAIKNGRTAEMDVGCIKIDRKSKHYFFLGSLSIGLGTTVNRYVEQFQQDHKLLTRMPPFYQLVPGLWGIHDSFSRKKLPLQLKLEYSNGNNGKNTVKEFESSLLVILNTPYYANGFKLGGDNGAFDGLLDCCFIDTRSFWDTFLMGLRAQRGTHTRSQQVKYMQAPSFKVFSEKPIDIQSDGEIIEEVKEFEVSVIENKIKMLCI